MSDVAATAQRQQVRQQGLILGLVTLPFRCFGVLCGSLFLCIVIECIGMALFWPDQGWRHAQAMLGHELDQLSDYFVRSALVQEPGRTAHQWIQHAYEWAFVRSGLLEWMQDASRQARAGASGRPWSLPQVLATVSMHAEGYLIAAAYTVLLFLVRLLMLCLTLPLLPWPRLWDSWMVWFAETSGVSERDANRDSCTTGQGPAWCRWRCCPG